MAFVLGVLVFVVGLLVSIGLHELGHMVPAKRFGVRVSQYMIGFGPTLFSRTRGETEYGLKAVPLGGYVRLVGMFAPADVVGAHPRAGRLAEISAAARDASAAEIRPGEDHRAFYRLSTPKKLVVMLGGPVMNLVIAAVLMAVVLAGFGVLGSTTTVDSVSECVQPAETPAGTACTAADPVAPAAAAGMRAGDRVVAYDGVPVTSWTQLQGLIRASTGEAVDVTVRRDGAAVDLRLTPALVERPVVTDGAVVTGPDGTPTTARVGFLGVTPTAQMQRRPLSTVPGAVGDVVVRTVKVVFTLPVQLYHLAQQTFGSAERDQTSLVGVVGVGRFAGEITSARLPGYGLAERTADMLGMLASLNVALFAFNLIPLVPLDGGHVAGALWEGARRQVFRLRGRRSPLPADTARMMPLAYAVFVVLAGMGLLLVYADLARPVSLGG